LGTWSGTIDREAAVWLRFYDEAGNLVLLPEEASHQRAEASRQRAERLAAREMGDGRRPKCFMSKSSRPQYKRVKAVLDKGDALKSEAPSGKMEETPDQPTPQRPI